MHAYTSKYDRIQKMATGKSAERQYTKFFKWNLAASVDGYIWAKMYKKVNCEDSDD